MRDGGIMTGFGTLSLAGLGGGVPAREDDRIRSVTMTDRDFLIWIHARLVDVYHERDTYDYMHRLRAIILATDKKAVNTYNDCSNSLADLYKAIEKKDNYRWWRFKITRG
jgi:hypothetical protein